MSTDMFKLTNQIDWPHSEFCGHYDFSFIGGLPTRMLLASALTPRTRNGQSDIRTRVLLHYFLYRLNASQIRKNRRHLPTFGKYRYTWCRLEELAERTDLSTDQTKRSIERLVAGKIVYSVRASRSDVCSYRLTDEAFMMAHAFQYPVLKANWLYKSNFDHYPAAKKYSAESAFREIESEYPKSFLADFHKTFHPIMDMWHKCEHPSGRRYTPYETGFIKGMEKAWLGYFEAMVV